MDILILFCEFCKNVKNTFLQDSSRRLLLMFRKPDIQTFNSEQNCALDQYCQHVIFDEQKCKFQDFRTSILQLSKNNFQPEKFSLDICQSDIHFNPIFIPCFLGHKFFRVQVFEGPGLAYYRFFLVNFLKFVRPLFLQNTFG